MGQQPSILITNQQSFFHILTLPEDMFALIVSFMDSESQLALAYTCKIVYTYHKKQCKKEIVAFLCLHSEYQYRKILERWLNKPGWAAVKVILKKISTDSLKNNSYPIRALFLDKSSYFPIELKCESINAFIFESTIWASSTLLSLSFLRRISNLKILRLITIFISENTVSVLSEFPLLKVISLDHCEITYDHLSKIFETCTTLEEIELYFSIPQDVMSIMFPPQMKRLHIMDLCDMQIDLSCCTQLQSL
jgi:hypothetical protein